MIGLRHQYQYLARFVSRTDFPNHPILVGDRLEIAKELADVSLVAQIEDGACEETAGFRVVELVRFEDVTALGKQFGGHARDNARLVRSGQFQQVVFRHGGPEFDDDTETTAIAVTMPPWWHRATFGS